MRWGFVTTHSIGWLQNSKDTRYSSAKADKVLEILKDERDWLFIGVTNREVAIVATKVTKLMTRPTSEILLRSLGPNKLMTVASAVKR
jgi:hypothetical protein